VTRQPSEVRGRGAPDGAIFIAEINPSQMIKLAPEL
jgi:hypothetical protein